jgi:hypothetical protein
MDGWMDGWTDITKRIGAVREYVNMPKNYQNYGLTMQEI